MHYRLSRLPEEVSGDPAAAPLADCGTYPTFAQAANAAAVAATGGAWHPAAGFPWKHGPVQGTWRGTGEVAGFVIMQECGS